VMAALQLNLALATLRTSRALDDVRYSPPPAAP
jgi:hypothetical protein